jgi:uncharacterized membrane protein
LPNRTCEICGLHSAVYVCQECGRFICPNCQSNLLCKNCQARSVPSSHPEQESRLSSYLPILAFAIIFAGIGLIILGSLTGNSSSGSSGSCFFWPIPPVIACGFGSSPGLGPAFSVLVLIVTIIFFVFFLSAVFQWRRRDEELDA